MLAYLQMLSGWDWLSLGIVLLILEVFDAGGYLLWIASIAASLGLLLLVFPLPWELQLLLFAGLSALATGIWQRCRRRLPQGF